MQKEQQGMFPLQRNQKQVKNLSVSPPYSPLSYHNAINKVLTAGMQEKSDTSGEELSQRSSFLGINLAFQDSWVTQEIKIWCSRLICESITIDIGNNSSHLHSAYCIISTLQIRNLLILSTIL